MPQVAVRAARPEDGDAAALLLFESSAELYARYAGSRERALALLRSAFARPGNSASREVITVVAPDEDTGGGDGAREASAVGAVAAFPVGESLDRARRFLRLSLRGTPPWVWPTTLRIYRLGSRHVPAPPRDSFYVDALATTGNMRRRGVATALLGAAEQRARELGLEALALETELENSGAQALYEGFGFEERERCGAAGPLPGFVSYVKRL